MELHSSRLSSQNLSRSVPQKKSLFLRFVFLGLLLLCVIIAGSIALLQSKQYQFTNIELYGIKTFPSEEVDQFIQKYLSNNWIGIIPQSSTITFSKTRLINTLQSEFPIIATVHVTLPEPNTLNIYVQEKQPVCIWCFSHDECVFLDHEGIVYSKAPNFSDGVYPIFTSEETKVFDQYLGKSIIDPDTMYRFITLFKNLQSNDIALSQVKFLENGDISFAIEKLFGKYPESSTEILGTLNQDDVLFIRNIVTGLNHQTFKEQFKLNPKSLEYIDLRFPEKIFFKFKGKEKPLETVSDHVSNIE